MNNFGFQMTNSTIKDISEEAFSEKSANYSSSIETLMKKKL